MKTFVLFGATGDLATRYVLPALGELLATEKYDHLVCVGRRTWTQNDFRNFLAPYPHLLAREDRISYVNIDISGGDFSPLRDILTSCHALSGSITYHLCLSPEFFTTVVRGLASEDLNTTDSCLMIEKPFGYDLKSAILLNIDLQTIFSEEQIYRVDHYLGKNFVRELAQYRLTQGDNWYCDRVAAVHITARETLTIEDRGEYYDATGVTRDFLQNHLLQILALCTMKASSNSQTDLRDNIFMAISDITPLLLDPRHDIILGQYAGYPETLGVAPDSRTPTYIFTHLVIDNTKWRDVDVTIECGKALDRKETSVRLVFCNGEEQIFAETSDNKNNSYELLIQMALERDISYFVRWDSIRAAWSVVDDLLHCTNNCPILQIYAPGTRDVLGGEKLLPL